MSLKIHNDLFNESVQSLAATILSPHIEQKMFDWFQEHVPLTAWGKVDWSKIGTKITIGFDPGSIISSLKELTGLCEDMSVYILWSSEGLPLIETELMSVVEHFDDVVCVSFEKFLFNPEVGYVLEILPSNEMTLGLVKNKWLKKL